MIKIGGPKARLAGASDNSNASLHGGQIATLKDLAEQATEMT